MVRFEQSISSHYLGAHFTLCFEGHPMKWTQVGAGLELTTSGKPGSQFTTVLYQHYTSTTTTTIYVKGLESNNNLLH